LVTPVDLSVHKISASYNNGKHKIKVQLVHLKIDVGNAENGGYKE
jgi:hypothetical protein